ncbi:MAG: DUF4410 domain-containing protein [Mycobacterium sp.]
MKSAHHRLPCLFAVMLVAGCASTDVTNRKINVTEKIARPAHIWVYDFVSSSADVPADSEFAGKYSEHPTPQTAEEITAGREVSGILATQLVADIRDMGLPAERATPATRPQVNDIVIRGALLGMDAGSAAKRVVIGFGSGASELKAAVAGFQVTATGLRPLGSGDVQAGGGKSPGGAMAVAGAAATGNPVGLIVSTGAKVYGEASGNSKLEGRAKAAANEIAAQLKPRFEKQGWIE